MNAPNEVMKDSKVTMAEIAAVEAISNAWDEVTRWLATVDFAKTRDIISRIVAEGTGTSASLGPLGVASGQRKILETYELERVGKVLQALGCPCVNCMGKAPKEDPSSVTFKGEAGGLVSSVRVTEGPGHDVLTVWNRGANAGTLTVTKGEGFEIGHRLVTTTLDSALEQHEPLAQMRDLIVMLATQSIDSEKLVAIEADAAKLAHDAGWIR